MLTLILNKGTKNEKKIKLSSFYERPIAGTFVASFNTTVTKETDFPSVGSFSKDLAIESVNAVNSDGLPIPIAGTYNHIADFACNYDDETKRFGINLTLDWVEPMAEAPNAE